MKLNQFKTGQIVEDMNGNIYKVLCVVDDSDDNQPVKLKCIERKGRVYSTRTVNGYYDFKVGCAWWITKDELSDFSIVES